MCSFTGVDSAAMFQECLLILRSIVMHALGINTNTSHQSTDPVTGNMEKSTQMDNPDTFKTQSISTPAESQSSPSEPYPTRVIPRDKKSGPIFATPSPHSRISSGFGSLHDEDSSIIGNYYDQAKQGDSSQHPQKDSNLIVLEHRTKERELKKQQRRQKHHWHRSQASPSSCTGDPTISSLSDVHVQVRGRSPDPPAPMGAWVTPESRPSVYPSSTKSPRNTNPSQPRVESSSNNQSFKGIPPFPETVNSSLTVTPDANATTNVRGLESNHHKGNVKSPPLIKSLSPRAERQRKKLQSKQMELLRSKEEKQRLANEVNLLNLKVKEEGTK